MTIVGLTDNIVPRFRRLGKLRKGGEKTDKGYGPDLDHFRFTSDQPEIVEAFHLAYGAEPRLIRIYIPYKHVNDAFPTCCEVWGASGLMHRCDGQTMSLWREGSKFLRGEKPCPGGHEKDDPKSDAVGRLEFIIPELVQAGYVGHVTLETHSINDILAISSALQAVYEAGQDLRGVEFTLRRVKEKIGVPGWGDRKNDRARTDKWLVKIEPTADWVKVQLEASRAEALSLPAPVVSTTVDGLTGEIITQPAPSIDEIVAVDAQHWPADVAEGGVFWCEWCGEKPSVPLKPCDSCRQLGATLETHPNRLKTQAKVGQKKTPETAASRKLANVKTRAWFEAIKPIAEKFKKYQSKDGTPDSVHLQGVAAAEGFTSITDDNLTLVIQAIRDRAYQDAQDEQRQPEPA